MSKVDKHEPEPIKTEFSQEVWPKEIYADMLDRARVGQKKYGTRLMTHNGRDALMDAYQEALDLVMYLKQALMEREEEPNDE